MSDCKNRIGTAIALMASIEKAHDEEIQRLRDENLTLEAENDKLDGLNAALDLENKELQKALSRIKELEDALNNLVGKNGWGMPEIEEGYEGFDEDWKQAQRVLDK